jgi:hypothetical protein
MHVIYIHSWLAIVALSAFAANSGLSEMFHAQQALTRLVRYVNDKHLVLFRPPLTASSETLYIEVEDERYRRIFSHLDAYKSPTGKSIPPATVVSNVISWRGSHGKK